MRSAAARIALLALAALATPSRADDLTEARRLFDKNLAAIRTRDRAAYLACYLQSDSLARSGPEGFQLGYRPFAEQAPRNPWPDVFDARDLRLVPVREGIVYGTYRYRVRFGDDESSGLSERLFVSTPAGWRIAMTSAFPATPGVPPPPLAIVGATLVDGTGRPPVRNAVVMLRGGRIECAGPRDSCAVGAGVDTIDARGLWVTPGLVDAHVHYSQTGWADGRPDALDLRARHPYERTIAERREHPEWFHRAWLGSGVTSVFDVGGYAWTIDLQRATRDDTRAPRVAAAGSLISTVPHWLNLAGERQIVHVETDSAARAMVRDLHARGAAAVKVWFIVDPARDFDAMARMVTAAGEEARALGLPLIVHATGLAEAKAALRAGAKLLVHSVWDRPVDEEFLTLARAGGAIYCPTLTVLGGYARLVDAVRTGKAPRIDDPLGVVDSVTRARVASTPATARELGAVARPRVGVEDRSRTMAANLKRVRDAGIPIATGTDAGNPLTLHGPSIFAEMEAMQAAGMTPMEVLVASTAGGARAMGREAEAGTIEPGRLADLILLGADPTKSAASFRRLRWVIRGGVARQAGEFRAR
jgi:imidazolonepropionase-like amidohydrolase